MICHGLGKAGDYGSLFCLYHLLIDVRVGVHDNVSISGHARGCSDREQPKDHFPAVRKRPRRLLSHIVIVIRSPVHILRGTPTVWEESRCRFTCRCIGWLSGHSKSLARYILEGNGIRYNEQRRKDTNTHICAKSSASAIAGWERKGFERCTSPDALLQPLPLPSRIMKGRCSHDLLSSQKPFASHAVLAVSSSRLDD